MNRKRFIQSLAASGTGLLLGSQLSAKENEENPEGANRNLSKANWSEIRDLFPLRPERVYLNTGGLGPASTPVLQAVQHQNEKQAYTGEHHHSQLKAAHETLASFFGVTPEEVCFTRNASESNSIISAGINLKPGDEIVFESHAHPGGSFAWLNRQKRDGAKVRIFEPSRENPEANLDRLFSLVNERTRVIQVSHVTATTGLLFDVNAIAAEARKRGIWFHIDGAQSAGMFSFDLNAIDCDSFGTSGHKWLNGPIETGFLYIKKERNHEIDCSHIGAYSNDKYVLPNVLTYVDSAQRHEYGTRNAATALGLVEALELQNSIGRERIAQHGKRLTDLARARLESISGLEILTPTDPRMYNSILTFRANDKDCIQIYSALSKNHNLRCRVVTERDLNAVRASWHVYHTEADVERFANGVAETLKSI